MGQEGSDEEEGSEELHDDDLEVKDEEASFDESRKDWAELRFRKLARRKNNECKYGSALGR